MFFCTFRCSRDLRGKPQIRSKLAKIGVVNFSTIGIISNKRAKNVQNRRRPQRSQYLSREALVVSIFCAKILYTKEKYSSLLLSINYSFTNSVYSSSGQSRDKWGYHTMFMFFFSQKYSPYARGHELFLIFGQFGSYGIIHIIMTVNLTKSVKIGLVRCELSSYEKKNNPGTTQSMDVRTLVLKKFGFTAKCLI